MTFADYMQQVIEHHSLGGVEWGHSYYWTLKRVRPDLAEQIEVRGFYYDPRQDPGHLGDFLYLVQREWDR